MKIFISWSKQKSHEVAIVLRDWLPSVIQSLEPFVSSEEIDKGSRWSTEIAQELEDCSFGILCITEENLEEPWLMFEAGALSKKISNSYVCPFLLGIQRSDVKGPLVQFQSTIFEKEDVKKLLATINSVCGDSGISSHLLDKSFDVWWPSLEDQLKQIEKKKDVQNTSTTSSKRPKNEVILEELLEISRRNQRLLGHPETLLPSAYLEQIVRAAVNNRVPEQMIQSIQMNYTMLSDLRRDWDSIYPSIEQALLGGGDRALSENLVQWVRNIYSRTIQLHNSFWTLINSVGQ